MNPSIFKDGFLRLFRPDDLLKAEQQVDPLEVSTLRIYAEFNLLLDFDVTLTRVSNFKNLKNLYIEDDRIPDQEISFIENRIRTALPSIKFYWGSGNIAGGKHGR